MGDAQINQIIQTRAYPAGVFSVFFGQAKEFSFIRYPARFGYGKIPDVQLIDDRLFRETEGRQPLPPPVRICPEQIRNDRFCTVHCRCSGIRINCDRFAVIQEQNAIDINGTVLITGQVSFKNPLGFLHHR
jgi:hypothetical protein